MGMRLAVISDVHGNLTALEAVIRDLRRVSPDLVVQAGDLVANGLRPAQVLDRVRELGWPGVLGNTDEMLWRPEQFAELEARMPKLRVQLSVLFHTLAPATLARLGKGHLEWLRGLPRAWNMGNVAIVHAAPQDLWRAPLVDSRDSELKETYRDLGADVVCYGHIHRPFVRSLVGFKVCNTGSVGMPYDGDPRASYLIVDDGRPEIRRVEYDLAQEINQLRASDYPLKEWLAEILGSGTYSRPPEPGLTAA
jgi:predicted phosphodiesterase